MMEGRRSERRGERIPTVLWFTLKRSMHCKSEPSEVHDPKFGTKLGSIKMTKRSVGRSGCSRSIANLKDVIHGSKRHFQRPTSCSPRSIGSSEFLNPISHEVILSTDSRCELRIVTGFGGCHESTGTAAEVVGTLRPGTPGPGGGHFGNFNYNPCCRRSTPRRSLASLESKNGGVCCASSSSSRARASVEEEEDNDSIGSSTSLICHKCGEVFAKWDGLETHHLSHHAVTELVEGDSSRKIVEIICRANWLKSESSCGRIERVLKVHNMQKTLCRFEEYREMVKFKAGKLPKKHPRCLADGNELLRFHGTTVSCNLGMNGSSSLCTSKTCRVCQILRHGFTMKTNTGPIGVFTTATSARAFESIELPDQDDPSIRKALLVCRVIAGRVHKPLDNYQELVGQSVFDSLAGKVGLYANIEELYLLNPRALLPCFVVICKP